MEHVYLSLGSNVGDRLGNMTKAIAKMEAETGTVSKVSSVYETAAWGKTDQASFLNMAIMLQTDLLPEALMAAILKIEGEMGRKRQEKWGPRLIDIDILFYNDTILHLPDLVIPHPYMAQRKFVLAPLSEIAPDFVHPELQISVTAMLAQCTDELPVLHYGAL